MSLIQRVVKSLLTDKSCLLIDWLSRKKIGYVADSPDLFLRLTANEFWELVATSYDMNEADCEERLQYLLETFDFADHRYEGHRILLTWYASKVFVIGALLSDPDIWVLDEPLTGLDPQAAFDLKNMMREHADKGNTVIFSTHVLEVAEQLCDRLAILKKGELIFMERSKNSSPSTLSKV